MTIRTRLSLWYAAVTLASLSVMGGLSYHEFVVRHREPATAAIGRPGAPDRDFSPAMRARAAAGGEADRGGAPGGRHHGPFADVLGILLRVGVPAMLVAVAGGWWLMHRALAPIRQLTHAVERTNERNLRERLPRSGNHDEIDRLTQVFNEMTARLDESFQRIREFTLHASHELKTPLTVMQGELETACRDEALSQAQREALLDQLDEIQRLAKVVDNLSLLTKADAGQVMLAEEPVRLDDLVREMVEDLQHLAQGQEIDIELATCEPLTVSGDRHRIRQLLLNLADNAVKYNERGGKVVVMLRHATSAAEIVISNTGPGLPRELQGRVFERFFRGDASHSSRVDGSGLGLSIVEWIVQAHGGSVRFESEPGGLTTVTVRLAVEGRLQGQASERAIV